MSYESRVRQHVALIGRSPGGVRARTQISVQICPHLASPSVSTNVVSLGNFWNKRVILILAKTTYASLPMNCTPWLAAKKFLQDSPRASFWKYPNGITLTTVHLLAFSLLEKNKNKSPMWSFLSWPGKVSSISVQDVQDKLCGGTERFAPWQISGRGDRAK